MEMIKLKERLFETLNSFNARINMETLGEIASRQRCINASSYDAQPLVQDSEDLRILGKNYEESNILKIYESVTQKGFLSVGLFMCPNGDATDMANNFRSVVPKEVDKNQVFIQRVPFLKELFSKLTELSIPMQLNILIGDNDFMTYYYPHRR